MRVDDRESNGSRGSGPGSPDDTGLTDRQKEILRQVALESITMGLEDGHALPVYLENYPQALREPGAVFVTLQLLGRLRGCIGTCVARRPLVEDVAENAYAAAFRDPRFPPLGADELPELEIHLSLLSPPELLPVRSREDLLNRLRPGTDGLVLEESPRRATFLPQVWETLSAPEDFLEELLLKGGFPRGYWSPDLIVHRYTVEEF